MTGVSIDKFHGRDKSLFLPWFDQFQNLCLGKLGDDALKVFDIPFHAADNAMERAVFILLNSVCSDLALLVVQSCASKRGSEACAALRKHFALADHVHGPALYRQLLQLPFDPSDALRFQFKVLGLVKQLDECGLTVPPKILRINLLETLSRYEDLRPFVEQQFPRHDEPVDTLLTAAVSYVNMQQHLKRPGGLSDTAIVATATVRDRNKDRDRDRGRSPKQDGRDKGKDKDRGKPKDAKELRAQAAREGREFCDGCLRIGHLRPRCYKEHPELKPARGGKPSQASQPSAAQANLAIDVSSIVDPPCDSYSFNLVVVNMPDTPAALNEFYFEHLATATVHSYELNFHVTSNLVLDPSMSLSSNFADQEGTQTHKRVSGIFPERIHPPKM
jgi:hypothetical protein